MIFRGERFYLNNAYPCDIRASLYGREFIFTSAEALLQAKKVEFSLLPTEERVRITEELANSTPKRARAIGDSFSHEGGDMKVWEHFQPLVMESAIDCKFSQNLELAKLLIREDLDNIVPDSKEEEALLCGLKHFQSSHSHLLCQPTMAEIVGNGYAKRRTILEKGDIVYNYSEVIREGKDNREVEIVRWNKDRFSNLLERVSYVEDGEMFSTNLTFETVDKLFGEARYIKEEEYVLS